MTDVCAHLWIPWNISKNVVYGYTYAFRFCKTCGITERIRLECEHENTEHYKQECLNIQIIKVCKDCGRII